MFGIGVGKALSMLAKGVRQRNGATSDGFRRRFSGRSSTLVLLGALAAGSCRNTATSSDRRASALTVPTTATAAQILAAAQAQVGSPVQASVAQGFNTLATGLSPQFPAAVLATERKPAVVLLPQLCTSALHLQDVASGVAVDISFVGALPIPAQTVGGYAVYPAALAGATVLHRALPGGSEDFVQLPTRLTNPEVDYSVALGSGIAGLRLVGGTIEMLDSTGAPRLHVSPPYIVGADGVATNAALAVSDCAVDTDPSAPWGRAVTAPGGSTCTVRVTWPDAAVAYPAILDPRWTTTGSMGTARIEHTISLLSSGRALVAGGRSSTTGTTGLFTAELYDPTSGTWSATGNMASARRLHSMTQLGSSSNPTTSGKVLVAGGISGSTSLGSAELYSVSAGTWSPAGNLNVVRHAHSATLLADGRVLIAGGMNGTSTVATAALYNPASGTGSWVATTGPIPAALKNHTATLIQTTNTQLNNHVLLVGGNNGTSTVSVVYLFDPVQNAFSTLASISSPREQSTAATLQNANGKILIAGGKNGSTVLATAIVFDPSVSNGTWSSAGTMTSARVGHSMTLLPSTIVANGQVLVAGGSSTGSNTLATTELFSGTATWTATPSMPGPSSGQAAVLLGGNSILTAGGLNGSTVLTSAFLYDASFGLSCTTNSQCASDFCSSGICCNTACTGTCGACNLAGSLGTCSPLANGTVCRAAAGACDVAETCNGTVLTCPSDGLAASGTVCRAAAGVCDVAETCSGSSAACPADGKKASGTACTDDGNPCTKDQCDGSTVACQHPVGNAGTVCRAAAGACDVAETCTGSSATCPADGFATASTVCRTAAGECDVAETCSGTSAACPADTKKASGTTCTDDGNVCTKDQCDGSNVACQHPAGNAGTICRASAGACDVAEACTGSSTTCPADGFATASTVCRTAAGECDLAETCTGSSASCPTDTKKASGTACTDDGNVCTKDQCDGSTVVCQHPAGNAGTICRASAGACDIAETCTGTNTTCPADQFASSSTVCRASAGACDVAESCTGSSATCPADGKLADGTTCSDGNACTQTDTCQSGTCVGGNPITCTAADQCHTGGTCNPSTGVCSNVNAPDGTPCNDGNACTNGDACQTGMCVGGDPVTCVAQDECHTRGICDPTSGGCASQVVQSDGTPCTGGVCLSATCQPLSAAIAMATTVDRTIPTNLEQSTAFLYTGSNASQIGMSPNIITHKLAAVMRGKVVDTSGNGIVGASVVVVGRPAYGVTVTGAGGVFNMAVNGGEQLEIEYKATGHLPIRRRRIVRELDYSAFPDVTLTELDPARTVINLSNASSVQVAQATPSVDADGIRRSTLLFLPGTTATVVDADGQTKSLPTLTVHSTEYTVGPQGPSAMPADLPPSSGYTYASELTAEEASAGNFPRVSFSQPIIQYLDNFIDVTVGTAVPVGYYDRTLGGWIPENNGKVIKIISTQTGTAEIDTDGDGLADPANILQAAGITDAERTSLAELYVAGQSLWRIPLDHFTSQDYNFASTAPNPTIFQVGGDGWPQDTNTSIDTNDDPSDDDCESPVGSVVDCNKQTLGEQISLTGIPAVLDYSSARVPGFSANLLNIKLSDSTLQQEVSRIDLDVQVAGQDFQQSFPALPSQNTTFTWNGMDPFGRLLPGRQPATVAIKYVYNIQYLDPPPLDQAFAANPPPGVQLVVAGDVTRGTFTAERDVHTTLALPDARAAEGLGGWEFNIHHTYDPRTLTLALGDGSNRMATPANVALIPQIVEYSDYLPMADGSIYFGFPFFSLPTDPHNLSVMRSDGTVQIVATAVAPTILELDGTSVLYMHQGLNSNPFGQGTIFRLNSDGTIDPVAGNESCDESTLTGDEGPATTACFGQMVDMRIATDGDLFVTGSGLLAGNVFGCYVRRIDRAGIVHRIDTDAGICGIATGPGNAIYLEERSLFGGAETTVNRLLPDGSLSPVIGQNNDTAPCADNDGSNGIRDRLCIVESGQLRVGADGMIFAAIPIQLVSQGVVKNSIVKIRSDGTSAELFPGLTIDVQEYRIDPNGDFIVSARLPNPSASSPSQFWGQPSLYRLRAAFPGTADSSYNIPSRDGSEIYQFDSQGRHLDTLDALTATSKFVFGYDSSGYVNSITDRDGRATMVQRDGAGNPTAILSPTGQQTTLAIDANGYLATVTSPGGAQQHFQYSNGLLTSELDARGGTHTFTYDAMGRLIRDQNAAGGNWTLSNPGDSHTDDQNSSTVTMTSGEGRTSIYQSVNALGAQSTVGPQLQGNRQSTTTGPDGLAMSTQTDSQGGTLITAPDGTTTQTTMAADPHFGMAAPYVARQSITTPSGLNYLSTSSRTATIASDGVTLISQTGTTTINGQTSTAAYDGASRTVTLTSPVGRQRVVSRDDHGHVTLLQSGAMAPTTFGYDSRGRVTSMTVGLGPTARVTGATYNDDDLPATATDPMFFTSDVQYDADDRIATGTDPDGAATGLIYDPAGDLLSLTPPGRPAHQFTYTPVGDVMSYTAPSVGSTSSTTTRSYNLDRQINLITRPDGRTISFGYDSGGRPSTTAYDAGTVTLSYSPTTGALVNAVATDGSSVDLAYDGRLLVSGVWSGVVSGEVSRTWNSDFRVATESINASNTISYSYDPDGLINGVGAMTIGRDPMSGLVTGTTLGGVTDTRSYNPFGERTGYTASYSGSSIFGIEDTRDNLGRVSDRTETISGTSHTYHYAYDPSGQLNSVSTDGVATATYVYDPNGNRLSKTTPAGLSIGTYDAQDRLLTYGNVSYSYTANGELATKTDATSGQVSTYSFDALGNLRSVALPDGRLIEYVIDGMNRRIGKKINGQLVTGWLYRNNTQPLAELDGTNSLVAEFDYSSGRASPVSMIKNGTTYSILSDDLGTPRRIVDSATGVIAEARDVDEFGVVVSDSAPGFQPFGFAGGVLDADTGLIHFGARDYDPVIGRWISKDPAGFDGGSSGLYKYANNDPVNGTDLSGLDVQVGIRHFDSPAYYGLLKHCLVRFNGNNADTLSFDLDGVHSDAIPWEAQFNQTTGPDNDACVRQQMNSCSPDTYNFFSFNCCMCVANALQACGLQMVGQWPNAPFDAGSAPYTPSSTSFVDTLADIFGSFFD